MNNQARNFPPPSQIGNSGTTPQQPHQPNPLISSHAQSLGHTQIPDAITMLLAQQAQFVQAHHGQVQSHSQAQLIQAHLQAQAQSISQLHNANAIANAIANANANSNIANANALAIANANANAIAIANANAIANTNAIFKAHANANASASASAIANVVPSSSSARKSKKRAAKKSTSQGKKDSNLPEKQQVQEKLVQLLPNSAFYTKLLDHDAEIDAALEKMKIEAQECIRNRPDVQKTLRVYVFNTFVNQTKPGFLHDKKSDDVEEEPSWSLKITGRIVEENEDDGQITNLKFSNFFKRIFIYLDENLYPDDHVIVWDSDHSLTPNDGFEVKRKGDKEFTAKIIAEINHTPEKFILSKPLSEILGLEFETHSRIVAAFWDYVHSKNLNIPNNLWLFKCDTPLKRLFGDYQEEKILKFGDAIEKLSDHLTRPKPIEFEHMIKLSGDCLEGISCYDVQVGVPFKLEKDMEALMELKNNWVSKGVEAYDKMTRASFEELNEHRRRRSLFLSFSQDPEGFVNAFIDSQCKGKGMNHNNNNDAASGSGNHRAGKEIRSDEFFNQPWVEDAVIRYMNQKTAGGEKTGSGDANVDRNRRNTARGKAPMKYN